ncbi:TIGR03905 family TSCPD domain-containing protein [Thiospirochaeta perfilievii]|uniref:ribonucleoside-diphosphate reductase n=1 Tax=Thiospirochaeta perfilievii TaxID=252967 RepID=A0A5C1QFL4_9SPIO|nr:TIGR03905 family TSCPD domain-containing protein [Thiospirochaeta perfilievii]QEN05920.1 TIGR03905 family TSCPD domain-containing protein [Thiospirochaeta perfilievii]
MEKHKITPNGVCAKQIDLTITSDNQLKDLKFTGGCPGNAIGLSKLVEGMDINRVIDTLQGTSCGKKETSCPDQLALALKKLIATKISA